MTAAGICGTGSAPAGLNGKPVNGRGGPDTRIPLAVISRWAEGNYVDHTHQSSVVRFIEDNWLDGQRIGGGSFDATAGSIMGMFDFDRRGHEDRKLFLDPETGLAVDKAPKV